MSKKDKKTSNKPANVVPRRQQRTSLENMSGEQLAVLLGEQYKMVMQCQNNIVAINNVLEQRKQALAKKVADGK